MKKIIYVLSIIVITLISCKNEAPIDYTIVSGKIQNSNAEELILATKNGVPLDTLMIANDGSFLDTLSVNEGRFILFDGVNQLPLYITVANNIIINYDVNNLDNTLTYSGVGSEINNYLVSKRKKEKELEGEKNAIYKLDEIAYKAKIKEIKEALLVLISSSEGISESFIVKEKRNINYEYLAKINKYEQFHAYFAKKPDFKVSEEFLNELENLDFNNEEDFLFSDEYKKMVSSHYNKKANELAKSDTLVKEDITFLKIAGDISNSTIKNSLLFNKAKFGITVTGSLDTYYNTFMAASTNDEQKKELTEAYNILKVVEIGQPSPKFVDYENYNGDSTSLDDLLGKYVYIDVWATWCGPCKREIPFLKEIEKQYHERNIEFVSVSVDKSKDHDKWATMIKEKELGGIQLFADKSFESDFIQSYMIKGIPKFILIDPQGNIVKANAPRPSDPRLKELLDKLKI